MIRKKDRKNTCTKFPLINKMYLGSEYGNLALKLYARGDMYLRDEIVPVIVHEVMNNYRERINLFSGYH